MKRYSRIYVIVALTTTTLFSAAKSVQGQGSLTPPGAPSPTMKTLDQIEPRTPISTTGYIITQSGSYYLTTNLVSVAGQDGIRVEADNVTIDLGGFVLEGTAGSWHGIRVNTGIKSVRIKNGTIRHWGYAGIYATSAESMDITDIFVCTNGYGHTTYGGIHAGADALITHCMASSNRDEGIAANSGAVLEDCTSAQNGGDGFYAANGCSIAHCTARDNDGDGFQLGSGCVITDCAAYQNSGWGIYTSSGNRIESNVCRYNASGIRGSADNTIADNQCTAHTMYGIYLGSSGNTVDNNSIDGGTYGIYALNASTLTRNRVSGAGTTAYQYNSNTRIGTIIDMSNGGAIVTTNPWANFIH